MFFNGSVLDVISSDRNLTDEIRKKTGPLRVEVIGAVRIIIGGRRIRISK